MYQYLLNPTGIARRYRGLASSSSCGLLDSNPDRKNRNLVFYPLNYGANYFWLTNVPISFKSHRDCSPLSRSRELVVLRPPRFEPRSQEPESCILSVELWGRLFTAHKCTNIF